MNVHDSEKLSGMLEGLGYVKTDQPKSADLILINTCCVRENAENRTYGHLGTLKVLKKAKPNLILGVCGCMAQEPNEVEKIKKTFRHVDLVFGTHNQHQLPELLLQVKQERRRVFEVWESAGEIYEGIPVKRESSFKAWVTIMYGCNNFCAYCIVPYVRGRERSREPEIILAEIRALVTDGVQEVTLLGQNVNSYGKDFHESNWNFAKLLQKIVRETGVKRIRFQTSHPKDLSEELIEVIANEPVVCHHLHLPVQAGSSRILELMNRNYTKEDYLNLLRKIKEKIPDIALSTDVIVGFPSETQADFDETIDLVKQVRYDSAFTFIYSPRKGTPAVDLIEQVPEMESKQHLRQLIELQNQISLEKNQGWVGRATEILVEGPSEKKPKMWSGRNPQNKLVHFIPEIILKPGDLVWVKITAAHNFTLEGKVLLEGDNLSTIAP